METFGPGVVVRYAIRERFDALEDRLRGGTSIQRLSVSGQFARVDRPSYDVADRSGDPASAGPRGIPKT